MCGIYGFTIKSKNFFSKDILKMMGNELTHRGPDQSDSYIDETIAMGIERLSIIDIKNGNQPIYSNNGRFVIVHNGEIYNYKELKKELKNIGYRFDTDTDTELIVNLYEYKGAKCLDDLNGMFAFAIYDIKKRELFIGRDRFGIKPVYYFWKGDEFIFASELKGLLKHPNVTPTISAHSIDLFLSMEFVPTPMTIYKEIKKLEQGHYLIISDDGLQKKKWYQFSYHPKVKLNSEDEYIEKLDSLIANSVDMRTLSDVPLGSFLSGGLDSSLITYYLSRVSDGRLKTFNISFEDESFNESEHANVVSTYLDTDHYNEVFSSSKMMEILPSIWSMMDEPFADASLLPTFLLSHFTKERVTVALSGDGGDEVFAGYPMYFAHKIVNYIPIWTYSILRYLSKRLPVKFNNMSLDFKFNQFCKGLGHSPNLRHQYWLGSFDKMEKNINFTKEFNDQINNYDNLENILEESLSNDFDQNDWEKHLYQDFQFYLQDDMLVKVDRASMTHSLEVRVPYLDHNIVEFMASVPKKLKYPSITSKYLLKALGEKYLPKSIVNRSKKGFGIPVADWLLTSLKSPMEEIVRNPDSFINSIFDKKYTLRLMKEHLSKKHNNRKLLWTLFTLENWYNNQSSTLN